MANPLNKSFRVTSPFGWRMLAGQKDYHAGCDLVPQDGKHPTELFVTVSGIVEDVRNTVPNTHTGLGVTTMVTGNYINIRTSDGYLIIYRHLKCGSIPFTKGQKVNEGNFVGIMHTTGQSTGVHLHYEIRNSKNESLNPEPYLYGTKTMGGGSTVQPAYPDKIPDAKPQGIKVGDIVKVNKGAKAYNGVYVAKFIFDTTYKVDQLKGDRAVLDLTGIRTAFNVEDLTKV